MLAKRQLTLCGQYNRVYIVIECVSQSNPFNFKGRTNLRNIEKDEIEMAARREKMLKEGFRLFSQKGIDSVSMQEVAKACKLGVATLYRYYKTKLDLVLAIGTREWKEYTAYVSKMRSEKHSTDMTAGEAFGFYLDFYIDLYLHHKDLLIFNQDLNNYIRHEGASEEQLEPYRSSINVIGKMFHELYERGKKDGTLRTDLPEEKMFAATSHLMISVAVRYAQGLVYAGDKEEDMTEEFLILKNMMIKEYVVL